MKFHPEELELARSYTEICPLPGLSREQLKAILDRGRQLFRWHKAHPVLHALINLSVFVFLFTADYYVLLALPSPLLHGEPNRSAASFVLAALTTGGLHSWLLYSLGVFSMHEGAAHGISFPHADPVSRFLNRLASNLCRISACEPRDYSVHHMSHHAKFGTENDGEFLNFVSPRRYWATLLPFGTVINYSDFIAHRPLGYTRSRPGVYVDGAGAVRAARGVLAGSPAAIYRTQPDAAREQPGIAQLRHRFLGAADRRRSVGFAVSLGTSPRREPAVVPAADPAPRPETHAHSGATKPVPARTCRRLPQAAVADLARVGPLRTRVANTG